MHELRYYLENEDRVDRITQDYMIVDEDAMTISSDKIDSSIKIRYRLRRDLLTQNMAIIDTNDDRSSYIISPNYSDSYSVVEGFDGDLYDSSYSSQYQGLTARSKSLLLLQFLLTAYNLLDKNINITLDDETYINPTFLEHDMPLNLQYRYKDKYLVVRTNAYLNLEGVYKIERDNRNEIRNIFISLVLFLHMIDKLNLLKSRNKVLQDILVEMKEFVEGDDMVDPLLLPVNYKTEIYLYEYYSGNIEDILNRDILKDILGDIIDKIVLENRIDMNTENIEIRRYDIPL